MHAAGKLARQRRVDHAVALEPALSAKGFGHDIQAEVRFAARPVAGVTFVPVGFVFDTQAFGRESLAQLFVMRSWVRIDCSLSQTRSSDGQRRRRAVLPPVKS